SARHATQRDACVSGKLRNDDDGLIWPTIVPEARLQPCRRRVFNMTGRFFTSAGQAGFTPWPPDHK
ncbi:MAG: hypothetical protein V3T13_01570, partial [Hyphomicrobium sp.]